MVLGHVCVKSHHTSGVSVSPENPVAYSAGNGGQKNCWAFFETALFWREMQAKEPRSDIPVQCTVSHQRLLHEGVQACVLLRLKLYTGGSRNLERGVPKLAPIARARRKLFGHTFILCGHTYFDQAHL